MTASNFDVILLAAGLSERIGPSNKLLLDWGGEPLIRRSAGLYCDLGMSVTVIVGHQASAVRAALEGLPLTTVLNANFATGQQSSIRAGLSAVKLTGKGLLMALGDLPLLKKEDIAGLCTAFEQGVGDKILIPHFQGKRGNPVLLPAHLARQLQAEDTLPRAFMEAHPALTHAYPAPNTHFTADLDTQADLNRLSTAAN